MTAQPASHEAALGAVRRRIDAIDQDLRALLNQRAACAREVAEIKARDGGSGGSGEGAVYYRPEREAQILARLRDGNEGPLTNGQIERLFREIISCCLSLEQPLTVACLGPTGTYTEAAAVKQFGHFAKLRMLRSVEDVFREVESGAAHYGVVAVENSADGMVKHTLDCFMVSPLLVCAEIELPIHHALLAKRGADGSGAADESALREICAHEQSLGQCRHWLDANYPSLARRAVASNAEAARIAAEDAAIAAIASEITADRYGLDILRTNIEDHPDNKTRFLVIGSQRTDPSGRDRTSIMVSMRNQPGALYQVLEPFHRHGISLSRIESRPAKTSPWAYVFFIDFAGHAQDPEVAAVFAELEEIAMAIKKLGSYPCAAT